MGDFSWLAVVSGACALNMAGHVLWFRMRPAGGLFRALLAGFVLGGIAFAMLSIVFRDNSIFWHALNLAIYASFSWTYFHWNNMGETGRRVRLVIELDAGDGGLARAEILARYGSREIIDRRLERMLHSRQIRMEGTRFYMDNRSFLAMARVVGAFKRLLNVQERGA